MKLTIPLVTALAGTTGTSVYYATKPSGIYRVKQYERTIEQQNRAYNFEDRQELEKKGVVCMAPRRLYGIKDGEICVYVPKSLVEDLPNYVEPAPEPERHESIDQCAKEDIVGEKCIKGHGASIRSGSGDPESHRRMG